MEYILFRRDDPLPTMLGAKCVVILDDNFVHELIVSTLQFRMLSGLLTLLVPSWRQSAAVLFQLCPPGKFPGMECPIYFFD